MSWDGGKVRNAQQRAALHKGQDGRCVYCLAEIGAQVGEKGDPVLEHYTPRHKGGHRGTVVLACGWCDKRKGMMHGREFRFLVRRHLVDGVLSGTARQEITRLAKSRNHALHKEHARQLEAAAAEWGDGVPDA